MAAAALIVRPETDDDDGEVAGHVSFTRGWLDTPRELVEVLVLSPLSVRPELQGHPPYASWMTGALVYPDVLWEHDAVGLRGPVLG